ncbi:MAG TPA: RNA polymerase sigma factor [Gemmataceae bacterium]|jgi:RNA polymerase sigma-70 factor (ECF subfamily)|nr:RNA polymerase sigma factor [Gemmataceae bacterium]
MDTTSVSLLDRLRRQPDAQSWQQLVAIYQPWLRGWLRAHCLQTADVDDVVQEVLAVLVKEIERFEHNGRRGAFRTWLRGIVVNRLRQFRRQSAAAVSAEVQGRLDQLSDDHSKLSQLWARDHDQHVVSQLLARIARDFQPITWQAFRAFVLQEKTATEVAAELGISVGAVWTAKSHVLKRLRQEARDWLH